MTADDWYAQLAKTWIHDPDNFLLSGAADWFEEQGEESIAATLRWMRDTNHHPRPSHGDGGTISSYDWFDGEHYHGRDPDDLPHSVYVELTEGKKFYVEYPTYREAVKSLAYALEKSGVLQEKE